MKLLLRLLAMLYVLCPAMVNAQSVHEPQGLKMTSGLDRVYANLELTKDLVRLQHCSDDNLQLLVRLNFSNKGKGPVVLDTRTKPISRYMVSRTAENATKRKYEFVVRTLLGYDKTDLVPDEANFTVLKPGETYSIEQVLNLSDRESMRSGQHVLQVVVVTWHYAQASNVEWRDRLRGRGYLWTDAITSTPMPFTIEKKAPAVNCTSPG